METEIKAEALLGKYEAEIGRLNGIIIRMQTAHETEMSNINDEVSELKTDLEAMAVRVNAGEVQSITSIQE